MNIGYRLTSKNRYSISRLYPLTGGKLFKNFGDILASIKNNNLDVLIYSFTTPYKSNVSHEIRTIIKLRNKLNKLDNKLNNKKYVSNVDRDVHNIHSIHNRCKFNMHKPILIAGGPHPTGASTDTINMGFDYVIVGEGEITLPKLLNSINNLFITDKLIGEYNKRIIIGEQVKNLDEFEKIEPLTPVEITRGCPYKCRFCQTPQIFGTNVRHRSIESILKLVNLDTDTRVISPNAFCYGSKTGTSPNIEKLKKLLIKLNEGKGRVFIGTFPSEVRPEFIKKETIELIVDYCDNNFLHFGAQSGSDELLKYIRRGHTVYDVLNAVDICNEYGIIPKVDFIFGFPNENEFHREDSMRLLKYILKKNGKIHAHYFIPLPGTYFENFQPSKLDKKTLKLLGQLSQKGLVSGSWNQIACYK